MITRITISILAAGLALQAQSITYVGKGSNEFQKQQLVSSAALSTQGFLVVLDGSDPLPKTLQAALKSDTLAELDLTIRPLDATLSRELRNHFGWTAGPRWAFLGRDFKVLAQGDASSTIQQVQARIQSLRLTTSFHRIQAFATGHPERIDAQVALLEELGHRARRRMVSFLRPLEGDRPAEVFLLGGTVRSITPDRELQRPLTAEEDARIWGDYVRQLNRLAGTSDWMLTPPLPPQVAAFSPLVQTAARRLLPQVEMALARHPHDPTLWRLAASLQQCAGRSDLLALARRLEPIPGEAPLPPTDVLPEIILQLRERGAWAEVRDLLLPLVRLEQGGANGTAFAGNWGSKSDFFRGIWNQTLSPLVEALLRLKDPETADEIVRRAADQHGTSSFPTWASQIALQCGERNLALNWAALHIEEKKPS